MNNYLPFKCWQFSADIFAVADLNHTGYENFILPYSQKFLELKFHVRMVQK